MKGLNLAFLFLLFSASVVVATIKAMPAQPNDFSSNNAYYQVMLDERGQASVFASIEIFNTGATEIRSINLNIPGTSVDFKYALSALIPENGQPYYNYGYGMNYSFANAERLSENTYSITLPEPVQQNGRATIFIYYKVFGYVSNGALAQDFDFQTIKFPFDADNTRVAISVDDQLILKGEGAKAEYQQTFAGMETRAMTQNQIASGSFSTANNIRYASGYVKTKSNLNAGETLHVYGTYADSWWKLYVLEIIGAIVVLGAIIYAIRKYVYPKIKKMFDGLLNSTEAKEGKNARKPEGFNASRALVVGFVSSVVFSVIAVIVFLIMIFGSISGMIGNSSGYLFIYILLVVLLGFATAALLGMTVASKFGMTEGIVAAIVFIGVSLILVPILVIVSAILMAVLGSMSYRQTTMNY